MKSDNIAELKSEKQRQLSQEVSNKFKYLQEKKKQMLKMLHKSVHRSHHLTKLGILETYTVYKHLRT